MVPIAIETFGAWGPEGAKLIKTIGEKIQNLTGENAQPFSYSSTFQRQCNVAMQPLF